ncbi:MAG: glutamine--fructose-6-phosphate transaminase (isomerizing) [Ruminococcaceae bacterium]|nr:glutamine--fructose-6-phosphate transaminase (isomerizing) [Oscillospiraceae bacterium]
MCGIVGYVGELPAAPLLLQGLKRLEYRGYDSAGIALANQKGLEVYRCSGRIQQLEGAMEGGTHCTQTVGIGHTRWATHGKPSDRNAHPHVSGDGRFAVVHNGIIENYLSLKGELSEKGYTFTSDTDSEVVAHLLALLYKGDVLDTIRQVVARLRGSFALGILCADTPGCLYAVKNASPLVIGVTETGCLIASDVTAILPHTRRIIRMEEGDIARLTIGAATVTDQTGHPVQRAMEQVDWDVEAAEKGGYAHFMLKEIMEQPRVLEDTMASCLDQNGEVVLEGVGLTEAVLHRLRRITVVACGSAYHAGMAGRYFIEQMTGLPVEVDIASEFRYRDPLVDEHTLTVVISQSGETADTLAALREAKARGSRVLAIVNVVGSSVANESDDVLYTRAGPEIAVATTKGYTTQVAMLYMLGVYMGRRLGRLTVEQNAAYVRELRDLPALVERCLTMAEEARTLAETVSQHEHAYFIGRHVDYAVALEASLKLKEISYIHAESYGAGELKHGTISLVEEGTLVVALASREELVAKMLSNIKEVKARGATVLTVTDCAHRDMFRESDALLTLPVSPGTFAAIPMTVPMQLLAYYTALARGCDIDKPRNLAKSVTVE